MNITAPPPSGLDPTAFLQNTWQQQPGFFQQALPEFTDVVSKLDLLKLCQDEFVQSRLVIEKDAEYPWQVLHGPVTPDDINRLPDSHWTVLVQNMEMYSNAVFDLLQRFSFLPNWRIDDIMISYASAQGSVGPHLDSYDVFLLQTSGSRDWYINVSDYSEDDFIDGLDLRILEDFTHQQHWRLEPGDMLYLPHGVAHHGVAEGESITCSIGFRAPQQHEILGEYVDDQFFQLQQRYTDTSLTPKSFPHQLEHAELSELQKFMLGNLTSEHAIHSWLGCYLTRLPELIETALSEENIPEVQDHLDKDKTYLRNLKSRILYSVNSDNIELYVNGSSLKVATELEPLILTLCQKREFSTAEISEILQREDAKQLIDELIAMGFLYES